jgi:alkylation response protein AidB-like acyl-CoA dehydrogenase
MTTIERDQQARKADLPAAEAAYGAMPDTAGVNFYRADPNLAAALARYLPPDLFAHAERILDEAGAVAGGELAKLAAVADKNPPQLVQYDRRGRRVDQIVKHPAYVEMERIVFERFRLNAVSHVEGLLGWPGRMPPIMKYALSYVLVQAEFGLFCPVNMTDSTARVLLRFADQALIDRFVPALLEESVDRLYQGTQFLTEKDGGSDVGQTGTVARRDANGNWRLYGDKWFCSNAGADLVLTLGRPEGAPPGTKGLGLFLMPFRLEDGEKNAFTINRLKDKLGSKSMPTGEYTLNGALAYQVGPLERGFAQMMEMVNHSRLSNAMRATAMMRRGYLESVVHARGRKAFGRALADLPLMQEKLLELQLESEAALAVVLQAADQMGRADAGDAQAARLLRVLTPLAKWWICKRARYITGEAMEVRGGNGYIEDWPNARLLRDAHLGSIWEGSSNVMLLDVARAEQKEGSATALCADIAARLDSLRDTALSPAAGIAHRALDRLQLAIARLPSVDEPYRDLPLDGIARRLFHLNAVTLLLEEADAQAARGGGYRKLLLAARYLRAFVYPPSDADLAAPDTTTIDCFTALTEHTHVAANAAASLLAGLA